MNALTKEQQRRLNAKVARYQTAKRRHNEAANELEHRHEQVIDYIDKLPILYLQTEDYKQIISSL